jgi:hypothetical protein
MVDHWEPRLFLRRAVFIEPLTILEAKAITLRRPSNRTLAAFKPPGGNFNRAATVRPSTVFSQRSLGSWRGGPLTRRQPLDAGEPCG